LLFCGRSLLLSPCCVCSSSLHQNNPMSFLHVCSLGL
jgi:hypothetical protein